MNAPDKLAQLLTLTREPWQRQIGDKWSEVADLDSAVRALGDAPRRVFLTIGRLGLAAFARAPQHFYLVRTIDPPGDLAALPNHQLILARGPFAVEDEERLMRNAAIDVLVSKNSGGAATYAKMIAARHLGLRTIVIAPPSRPDVPVVHDIDARCASSLMRRFAACRPTDDLWRTEGAESRSSR